MHMCVLGRQGGWNGIGMVHRQHLHLGDQKGHGVRPHHPLARHDVRGRSRLVAYDAAVRRRRRWRSAHPLRGARHLQRRQVPLFHVVGGSVRRVATVRVERRELARLRGTDRRHGVGGAVISRRRHDRIAVHRSHGAVASDVTRVLFANRVSSGRPSGRPLTEHARVDRVRMVPYERPRTPDRRALVYHAHQTPAEEKFVRRRRRCRRWCWCWSGCWRGCRCGRWRGRNVGL